jgi:hypothetical protein
VMGENKEEEGLVGAARKSELMQIKEDWGY